MNSRIFAISALSFILTACTTPILSPSPEPVAEPETADVAEADNAVPEPESAPKADIADIKVAVIREPETGPGEVIEETEARNETPAEPVVSPEATKDSVPVEVPELAQTDEQKLRVQALCKEIGNKLGSVSVEDCLEQPLTFAGAYTVQSRPMVVRDFRPTDTREKTRILIMGGIHGDEYSSISIMFKWMKLLDNSNNQDFLWRFAPTVNPDGLLDGQAIRQNANGVDLNRNFPSKDWLDLAEDYWTNITNRNPRRYPGTMPASEPEVRWIVEQIQSFKPNVIVSVHAPYHLLDYDGPPDPPEQIGELHLHLLGVYPGSLGNYAGINLGIPVVTMELPSAGIMPSGEQIESMWKDLLDWLYEHHET